MEDRKNETAAPEETLHQMFGEVWNTFNTVKKSGGSDAGWKTFYDESGRIARTYSGRLSKELVLAAGEEAEAIIQEADQEARQTRYRADAKAFQESWLLYQSLAKELDINAIQAYGSVNPGKFARELGAAVYKAACGARYVKGSFAKDAFDFYEKYKDDAFPPAMLRDFEDILNRYPANTLQMMQLYEEMLKLHEANKKSAANSSAA